MMSKTMSADQKEIENKTCQNVVIIIIIHLTSHKQFCIVARRLICVKRNKNYISMMKMLIFKYL